MIHVFPRNIWRGLVCRTNSTIILFSPLLRGAYPIYRSITLTFAYSFLHLLLIRMVVLVCSCTQFLSHQTREASFLEWCVFYHRANPVVIEGCLVLLSYLRRLKVSYWDSLYVYYLSIILPWEDCVGCFGLCNPHIHCSSREQAFVWLLCCGKKNLNVKKTPSLSVPCLRWSLVFFPFLIFYALIFVYTRFNVYV